MEFGEIKMIEDPIANPKISKEAEKTQNASNFALEQPRNKKTVSLEIQYKSSMIAMWVMLIGMFVTTVYLEIYMSFQLWYKLTVLPLTGLATMIFMYGFILTTKQQLDTYLAAKDFQEKMKKIQENKEKNEKKKLFNTLKGGLNENGTK
jgi:ABC-type siderophore export system fused ATPase/permease subunit